MEIKYKNDTVPEEIVARIKTELGGRKLGKILDFVISSTSLEVTIKKMGTSILTFERNQQEDGISWVLTKEKIALTHRPMKKDMVEKLAVVISKTGGEMVS